MSTNARVDESIVVPTSPVPRLIGTNKPPSLFENSFTRRTLDDARSNIVQLGAAITTLSNRGEITHQYIGDHPVISEPPIHRLPPEILGEIFKYYLPPYRTDDFRTNFRATMLPSHICSYWRKVAISLPMLWSTVCINSSERSWESATALVTAWFSRTHGYPLSFRLYGTHIQPIINAILPYCESWKYIHLCIPPHMIGSLEPVKGHLPLLETLIIDAPYHSSSSSMQLIRAFGKAPNLHHLRLTKSLAASVSYFPFANLTSCSMACSIGKCLELLQNSFNLQSLDITLQYGIHNPPATTLQLPLLKSLKVMSYCIPDAFFNLLSLPALCDFQFVNTIDDGRFTSASFISLLLRSSCDLQNFLLFGNINDGDLIECLRHTPSLLNLTINGTIFHFQTSIKHLMPHMHKNGQVICLVPKLRDIKIYLENDDDVHSVVDVVESRWRWSDTVETTAETCNNIDRIRNVTILCYDNSVDSYIIQLEGLGKYTGEGLKVYLEDIESGDIYSLPTCIRPMSDGESDSDS